MKTTKTTKPETKTTKPETKTTKPETKTTKPETKIEVTGLTVKGIESGAEKVYGAALKNGKENAFYRFEKDGTEYRIPVNFDSFDYIVKENFDEIKGAEITATYKIRENGKTVSELTVNYNGDDGEKFPSLRQFYDRKLTGGIDTAEIRFGNTVILYVNRSSKFREIKGAEIVKKIA